MEIVSKGPESWKTTCGRCGTTYRYTLADLMAGSRGLYGSGEVLCPVCGKSHAHTVWGRT